MVKRKLTKREKELKEEIRKARVAGASLIVATPAALGAAVVEPRVAVPAGLAAGAAPAFAVQQFIRAEILKGELQALKKKRRKTKPSKRRAKKEFR